MMAVKTTPRSSLGQMTEWEIDVSSLNTRSARRLKKPSLSVSVDTDHSDPQMLQTRGEEGRQRLASLGDQVGRLAHDIRNPLSSIEWLATLLGRAHHSQEERRELADHCIQAVRSLDQLVANILVASSPLRADQESICLRSLFDEVVLLAMYPIRRKGIILHHRGKGKLTMIRGNRALLKQALLNLLLNAIHASEPDGPIEIHYSNETRGVREDRQRSSEKGIVIRIQDYGCGMTEDELSNIFRPFYSKRKGGTGLGLSIVQQIVHLHHGLIDITSQQGKGTTVGLFFPQ